jgi:hypothetical protein
MKKRKFKLYIRTVQQMIKNKNQTARNRKVTTQPQARALLTPAKRFVRERNYDSDEEWGGVESHPPVADIGQMDTQAWA